MNCKSKTCIKHYQNQLQLLGLWILDTQALVDDFFTYAAGARLGVDLRKVFYILPDSTKEYSNSNSTSKDLKSSDDMKPLDAWKYFLNVEEYSNIMTTNSFNDITISVFYVVKAIVQSTTKQIIYTGKIFKTFLAIGIILVLLPHLNNSPENLTPSRIIFLITSNYILFVFFIIDFHFLVATILDTVRRAVMAKTLTRMACPSSMEVSASLNFKVFNGQESLKATVRRLVTSSTTSLSRSEKSSDSPIRKTASPSVSRQSTPPNKMLIVPFETEAVDDVEQDGDHDEAKEDTYSSPSPGNQSASIQAEGGTDVVPKVDFQIQQNLYAWLYTRTVLLDYGHRTVVRANIYIGIRTTRELDILWHSVHVFIYLSAVFRLQPLLLIDTSTCNCLLFTNI